MKQFINKVFGFALIPLGFSVIGFLIIFYTSKSINFKINQSVSEIYVGDSHVLCAVNDSLISNSKNVSMTSESFYFSYFKIKKLIQENQNIKTVYLGFSYHSLSNYYNDFISGKFSSLISPNYFYVFPLKEQLRIIDWNLNNFPPFIKNLFSISYGYTIKNETFYYGTFKNNHRNTRAEKKFMENRLQQQYYSDNEVKQFSNFNLYYLDKIINYCKMNNIELVMINTPLHPYYKNKIPLTYFNKFNEIVNINNLKIYDFGNLVLDDSCFTPDGDHLSAKGAYKVTNELVKIQERSKQNAPGT